MERILFPVTEKAFHRLTRMGCVRMGGYRCPACWLNYRDWIDALHCCDNCWRQIDNTVYDLRQLVRPWGHNTVNLGRVSLRIRKRTTPL